MSNSNRIRIARSLSRENLPNVLEYGEPAYVKNAQFIIGNGDGSELVVNDWNNILNKPISSSFTATAAEDIPAYRFVAQDSNGKLILANNTSLAKATVIGIATAEILTDNSGSVTRSGEVTNPSWTLTPGTQYYLDINGNIIDTAPSGTTNVVTALGTALTSTKLYIDPNAPRLHDLGTYGVTSVNNRVGPVTINSSDVGLSDVENTKLSTWVGTANVTTVGTITTGVWHGGIIGTNYGGTGLNFGPGANQLLGGNSVGTAFEYKTLSAGDNIEIVYALDDITINNTYAPPKATTSVLGMVQVGDNISVDVNGIISVAAPYELPIATDEVLGGIKVGSNLDMTAGVLNIGQNIRAAATPSFAKLGLGQSSGTEVLEVTGNIKLSGDVLPAVSDSSSIGSATAPLHDIYLANAILFRPVGTNDEAKIYRAVAGDATEMHFQIAQGSDDKIIFENASGALLTIDGAGVVSIPGDLHVAGTTTTVSSTTVDISDAELTLNYASEGIDPVGEAGIRIRRAKGTVEGDKDARILWDEGTGRWKVINIEGGAPATASKILLGSDIGVSVPSATGLGASGSWGIDISGSSGSCSGNAATATKLANEGTLTINGVASSTVNDTSDNGNYTLDISNIKVANASSADAAAKWATARSISISGDATGSQNVDGSANADIALTLANSGVTAGAYTKVTVDVKGRVVSGTTLETTDIPTLGWSKIDNTPTTIDGYGIILDATDIPNLNWTQIINTPTTIDGYGITIADTDIPTILATSLPGVTQSTGSNFVKISIDKYGRVTGNTTVTATDIPDLPWSKLTTGVPTTLSGYGITDAYTKIEVDNLITGLQFKASVKAASTANIATLSGLLTVDNVTLVAGDRVLVKNQDTASQNGIYVADSGAWTRAIDADSSTPDSEIKTGMFVYVTNGTTNANSGWVVTTTGSITVGSTDIAFAQFNGLGDVSVTVGQLVKNGNQLGLAEVSQSTGSNFVKISIDSYGRVTGTTAVSGSDINVAYGSQTANQFLAAPNGSAGNPGFRTIALTDLSAINRTAGDTATGHLLYNGTTQATGQLDGGTTAPAHATRLNYDGYFYATRVYNAVWNDIVDFVDAPDDLVVEYGRVYVRTPEYSVGISDQYCQPGILGIASDTFGFGVGTKENGNQIPIAIGGFVLAYVDNLYPPGTPLTSGFKGELTELRGIDKHDNPERIVATFDRPEKAEEWNGIPVKGRHWVKVV
jgi:hypothetical protein